MNGNKPMTKPIIGILPLYDSEKDSIWMLPGYQKGLEKAGANTLIFLTQAM